MIRRQLITSLHSHCVRGSWKPRGWAAANRRPDYRDVTDSRANRIHAEVLCWLMMTSWIVCVFGQLGGRLAWDSLASDWPSDVVGRKSDLFWNVGLAIAECCAMANINIILLNIKPAWSVTMFFLLMLVIVISLTTTSSLVGIFSEIDRPLDFNETFVNSSVLNVVSIMILVFCGNHYLKSY